MNDSKINVVCIRYCYSNGGGPEKLIHAMAKYMDRNAMRLTVVLWRHPGSNSDFYHQLRETGIGVECLRTSRFNPGVVVGLIRLIRKHKAHVFHTHDFLSDIYGIVAAKISGCPSICSAHGFVQSSWTIKLYEYLDLKLMRFFDRLIAGSSAMKKFLMAAGVKEERIRLVNNAIDLEEIKGCGNPCDFRKEYGIDPGETIVGVVGRLSSEKGHADFLRAAARVQDRGIRVRFVIVGDGAEMDNLRTLARDLGIEEKVVFTGYYHNIYCFLGHCDIFVLPSLRESLPLSLVEAMSHGIPVVATRVGGVPDLVEPDETGLLVPPSDAAGMGKAIGRFLADPRFAKQMGRQGKEKVEQAYSARSYVDKTEAIYKNIAALNYSEQRGVDNVSSKIHN